MLGSREMIENRRYLDLFGGTGAVGIEALSRGATEVVFCEVDRAALRTLQRNLQATRLTDRAGVIAGDAFKLLARPDLGPFDVIYIAPPQYQGLWLRALQMADARPELLTPDGLAIVQVFPKEWTAPELTHLELVDNRRYGSTALYFFARQQPEAARQP
jgi:16S rRNA (guanine(966)-N(2))-methyltransferase RsmD